MAKEKVQINLIISTPQGVYFDDLVDIVTFKTSEGYIGLMPGATKFMAAIVPSKLYINFENTDKRKTFYVDHGIAQFKDDVLYLILNEIDTNPLSNERKKMIEDAQKKYSIVEEIRIKRKILENKK
ncbi:F-type H+-transporting ATPase subunit epsilon [Metamycoplasma subdolum]|uniref:ATP synthase epsilon chain n=1 Tax=Metamycoplasma subdolum TaxID=92407 RepID=A0A3M0A2B5_9BACT|nr:F0F1 ATP synthase subunit epsilon [Metamycoplasma subdolum]RMA79123.1 F-type H+-transporting ATPase subunit epsilon [Metamycoplasma subdolum]WPB50645.1 F0F1 ATP synthase subunit epsilon [Metamycoplasma subdolum]